MATVRAFGRDPATRLDLVLATVDALLLLGVTVLLFWPSRGPTLGDRSARRVARLASRVQLVERRTASSLAWGDLPVGAALYEGDALYVPAGASASIAFTDGTRVEVEENSFLVLEPRRRAGTSLDRAPITIALRAGDLSASVSSTRNLGVEIETTDHSAQIEAGGSMRVASAGGRSEVEVIAGNALVRAGTQTERLGAHEGRELSAAGMHELAAGARLLEPAPNAHVVFAGDPPPIEFRWSVPAPTPTRVQIAQDSQFREILRDAELGAQSSIFIYSMPSAGRYFWRILVGEASSPGRRLTLSRLIAPRVLGPIGGEFVLVPAGAALTLLWSPVPFAERYRVELARDATFGAPLFDQQTQESRSAIVRDLPEGPYFWRVRAATGETSGDPNAPIEFYLVHRPRLEAPQLYEPEIEIAPPGPSRPVAPEPAAPSQPEKGAWLDRIWSLFVGTAWAQEPAPLPAGANRTAAATARFFSESRDLPLTSWVRFQ